MNSIRGCVHEKPKDTARRMPKLIHPTRILNNVRLRGIRVEGVVDKGSTNTL